MLNKLLSIAILLVVIIIPLWGQEQGEFLKFSLKSRRIFAEKSGHYIQQDEPELVINAIRQVTLGV